MQGPLKILLLEDNAEDAELTHDLLVKEKMDCELRVVKDKDAYLQALGEFQPDIILSDHYLPTLDSIEAFTIAREYFPGIPFIIITGTFPEAFAAGLIKTGVDDYILKDRMTRLPAAISAAMERWESDRQKCQAEQKIRRSEANLRAIFENTSEGFLLVDNEAVILAFNNRAAEYIFFSQVDKLRVGDSIYDFVDPSRKALLKEVIAKAAAGETIRYDRSYEQDGNWHCIDFCISPVRENGQVTGVCITGTDVTEKKESEREKEFDRNNLRALINNTQDLMWSVDRDLRLITSNEAFDNLVKAMSGDIVAKGKDILSIGFSREQLDRFAGYYRRAMTGESFTEVEYTALPVERWSEISFYPVYNGGAITGAACFSRDITARKKATQHLKRLEAIMLEQKILEQRNIARAIMKAQEKERNYLGQELHDNINQILASIKLHLESAGYNNQELKDLVRYPLELVNMSIEEIRLLCSSLVTPLKNIDLEDLVRKLLTKLEQNTGIITHFTCSGANEHVSDDLKINVYRILQEQVNNILKHAGASIVHVAIHASDGMLAVIVTDNGKGFDTHKKRKGVGLTNMINRMQSFNGRVKIESAPGKGCSIRIEAPY